MNGTARETLRDLRQGVIDRSPALLVMVLRWALVLVWMVYGPLWMVGLMARHDYAVAAFLLVSMYLVGKALWSAIRLFPRDDRVHRDLAAMVRAETVQRGPQTVERRRTSGAVAGADRIGSRASRRQDPRHAEAAATDVGTGGNVQ